jgi:hypothetical protein
MFRLTRLTMGLMAVAFLLSSGCGGKSLAKVTGKVTYKDQPLTSGDINFLSRETGAAAMAKIDSSGTFTLPEIEPGKYAVYFTATTAEPMAPGSRPAAKQAPVTLPKKVRDPNLSDLTVTIKSGDNPDVKVEIKD